MNAAAKMSQPADRVLDLALSRWILQQDPIRQSWLQVPMAAAALSRATRTRSRIAFDHVCEAIGAAVWDAAEVTLAATLNQGSVLPACALVKKTSNWTSSWDSARMRPK